MGVDGCRKQIWKPLLKVCKSKILRSLDWMIHYSPLQGDYFWEEENHVVTTDQGCSTCTHFGLGNSLWWGLPFPL